MFFPESFGGGCLIFEPVVGIDVAKNKSEVCILGPDNRPWGELHVLNHSLDDFERFFVFLKEVEKHFRCKPVLVCEATGHYHRLLTHFFSDKGFKVVVLNPIQSAGMKNINIRKVKSDQVDALRIAYVYRIKDFRQSDPFDPVFVELKELCHHQAKLVQLLTTVKNQTLAVLDQVFPEYQGIFYDTFGSASLKILSHFPSPDTIVNAGFNGLMDVLKTCPGLSLAMMKSKAELLLTKAQSNLSFFDFSSNETILRSNVLLIQTISKQIDATESNILSFAETIPDYWLLQSIPGIGPGNASRILSEIGSITRFKSPKQFVAFCGIDPTVKRSGNFTGTKNVMSKRGSPALRKALFMAALKSICQEKNGSKVNPVLFEYYQTKCKGKPKKVALGAIMHKLAKIIYAVLRDQKPFVMRINVQHQAIMMLLHS
jgi:transposase